VRFNFSRMLARHSAPYELVSQPQPNPNAAYDDDGVFVGSPASESATGLRGSIQPLSARWLQMDGGKYTEDDRALYTMTKHRNGDVIEHHGKRYKVDGEGERPDYSDVNKYLLKRVTTHDPL